MTVSGASGFNPVKRSNWTACFLQVQKVGDLQVKNASALCDCFLKLSVFNYRATGWYQKCTGRFCIPITQLLPMATSYVNIVQYQNQKIGIGRVYQPGHILLVLHILICVCTVTCSCSTCEDVEQFHEHKDPSSCPFIGTLTSLFHPLSFRTWLSNLWGPLICYTSLNVIISILILMSSFLEWNPAVYNHLRMLL